MIGGALMELSDKSLEAIGQYVKENLAGWLQEMQQKPEDTQIKKPAGLSGVAQAPTDKAEQGSPRVLSDTVLLERLIRLEEELKAQRTIMETRFEALDKRFEAIDKRFNDLIHYMDKRFEAVDKRFEAVDKRFEAVDKRFDDLLHHMDKRFETIDKRFSSIQWMMGLGFTLLAALMAVFNFF